MLNGGAELTMRRPGEDAILEFHYEGNEALCARITEELVQGPFELALAIKGGGMLRAVVECIYIGAGGQVKVGIAGDSLEDRPYGSPN